MQSLSYVAASNGVANASLMTVQTARAKNATSIITNTVANAPQAFYATMGTPHTFTDPVTGETITVISEATAVDFAGHILSGHIEIDAIAPGYTDNGSAVGDIIIIRPNTEWANNIFNVLSQSLQDNGALKTTALDAMFKPSEIASGAFVASGGIIAITTGLNASFSDIVYYIGGLRYTKTGVAARLYTASKDTYVDINAAGTLTYTEVANGAASPALTTGFIRLAKVVTSASAVTSVVQSGVDSNYKQFNPLSLLNMLSNIFGNAVQSYVNAGSAGGTFYYINLFGIKILWGLTAAQSVGTGGATVSVALPPGFFNNIQFAEAPMYQAGNSANQNSYIAATSTNNQLDVFILSAVNGSTQRNSIIVIGN